jgi:hypothetical protein
VEFRENKKLFSLCIRAEVDFIFFFGEKEEAKFVFIVGDGEEVSSGSIDVFCHRERFICRSKSRASAAFVEFLARTFLPQSICILRKEAKKVIAKRRNFHIFPSPRLSREFFFFSNRGNSPPFRLRLCASLTLLIRNVIVSVPKDCLFPRRGTLLTFASPRISLLQFFFARFRGRFFGKNDRREKFAVDMTGVFVVDAIMVIDLRPATSEAN